MQKTKPNTQPLPAWISATCSSVLSQTKQLPEHGTCWIDADQHSRLWMWLGFFFLPPVFKEEVETNKDELLTQKDKTPFHLGAPFHTEWECAGAEEHVCVSLHDKERECV